MSKRRIDLFLGLWHFLLPKVAGKMAPVLTVLGSAIDYGIGGTAPCMSSRGMPGMRLP